MDHIAESIVEIRNLLTNAERNFWESQELSMIGDGSSVDAEKLASYNVEEAFIHTLVLLEVKGLHKTYDKLNEMFLQAKKEKFRTSAMGIEEPYLVWAEVLRNYLSALATSYNVHPKANLITKDLISILRSSLYSITDRNLFERPPQNEPQVHYRIEGVLKCVFPDLKHKPQLTKPLKNFEPDTGLPSARTLIEYKFISNEEEAKLASDQLLTDTRGYFSKDWDNFLYVVYETHRVKAESKWNEHFRECGIDDSAKVIVLSGEPIKKKKKKSKTGDFSRGRT